MVDTLRARLDNLTLAHEQALADLDEAADVIRHQLTFLHDSVDDAAACDRPWCQRAAAVVRGVTKRAS